MRDLGNIPKSEYTPQELTSKKALLMDEIDFTSKSLREMMDEVHDINDQLEEIRKKNK